MRAPVKLAAFGGGLVVAFAAAFGVGSTFGTPVQESGDADAGYDTHASATSTAAATDTGTAAGEVPAGLMISDLGYSLSLSSTSLPAGEDVSLSFRILGPDGEPVTTYVVSHDKDLHLIAVRRDGNGYQHVHPDLADDGTWSVPMDLTPGSWRVFADFVPDAGGSEPVDLTLGADLAVAGDYAPQAVPPAALTAEIDGYTVTLTGELAPGAESGLTFSVARDGEPVTDLEPYLGAYGHLVALRAGDLAYLHVHPVGGPGDGQTQPGPDVPFLATVPSDGLYWLYLDFKHAGVVRTAQLTATAGAGHGSSGASVATPEDATPSMSPTQDEESGEGDVHDDDH